MYKVYITKVVDKESEWKDEYLKDRIGAIFNELGWNAFSFKKTWISWGKPEHREWHNAFEISWASHEWIEKEKIGVAIYLINKYFTGAKAVYSVGRGSDVKPFYIGSHNE